jgi:plasmid stabilization system protein ParE
MLPVDYLPGARRDFDESFDWYAERSPEAAVRFAGAVDAALGAVAAQPERFAAVDEVHRECPVKRFPFRIVYRTAEGSILVVAVAHAKRRPGYWRDRT